MAAAAPPSDTQENTPLEAARKVLGFLDFQGFQNILKIRKRIALSDKTALEVGADIDLRARTRTFDAALLYNIHVQGSKFATLRASRNSVSLQKCFPIKYKQLSFNFYTLVGIKSSGGPEFGFDVDDIKPVGVIVAAALSLLAAGKSLKASKAITAAKLSKPEWFYEDISLKMEVKAAAKRERLRPALGVRQLNAVIYV